MHNEVWLVGAGGMAVDYAKVLTALGADYKVIGRGTASADAFKSKTGKSVETGGLAGFVATAPGVPAHAIVATGVETLYETSMQLIDLGTKHLLIEKPGGLDHREINGIYEAAARKSAQVFIAYNRRFYASVIAAREIIATDGGLTSFSFEFTEWSHVIAPLKKASGVKERLFLNNSTHVADLAFYFGGVPGNLATFTAGGLDWHPAASIFAGAGVTESGALFSYQANWESAGRWGVELLTRNNRLILRPLEKLQVQPKGSIRADFLEIDYSLDEEFKPGLFHQTRNFLNNVTEGMCDIAYQNSMIPHYYNIANYELAG